MGIPKTRPLRLEDPRPKKVSEEVRERVGDSSVYGVRRADGNLYLILDDKDMPPVLVEGLGDIACVRQPAFTDDAARALKRVLNKLYPD